MLTVILGFRLVISLAGLLWLVLRRGSARGSWLGVSCPMHGNYNALLPGLRSCTAVGRSVVNEFIGPQLSVLMVGYKLRRYIPGQSLN